MLTGPIGNGTLPVREETPLNSVTPPPVAKAIMLAMETIEPNSEVLFLFFLSFFSFLLFSFFFLFFEKIKKL